MSKAAFVSLCGKLGKMYKAISWSGLDAIRYSRLFLYPFNTFCSTVSLYDSLRTFSFFSEL